MCRRVVPDMTMLHQYWTVAETQKKERSAPRHVQFTYVDLIIIIYYNYRQVKQRYPDSIQEP